MDVLGQSALLFSIVAFGTGISVIAANLRNKFFLSFGAWCFIMTGWAISDFLGALFGGAGFQRTHILFTIWLAPSGIAYFRMLIRDRTRFAEVLQDVSILLGISASVALAFGYESTFWVRQILSLLPSLIALIIFWMIANDWLKGRTVRRIPQGTRPLHFMTGRRVLSYACGVTLLLGSVAGPLIGWTRIFPAICFLALSGCLYLLGQSIRKQRFLNFASLVSRIFVLLGIALVLTTIYSLLFSYIENNPGLFFLNSFIVSFFLMTLLDPLRSFVRYITRRLVAKRYLRLEATLQSALQGLAGIVDTDSLLEAIRIFVLQTVQPDRVAIFVLSPDGTKFEVAKTWTKTDSLSGNKPAPLTEIIVDHPLLQYCEQLQARGDVPVLIDQVIENDLERVAGLTQRKNLAALLHALKALQSNVMIPMRESGKVIAFVMLEVSMAPEPWGNDWAFLAVIYPFFEQAARSLRNMEVYVRLKETERLAALGEMAAGLAHEIRNPLGAIRGAAELLEPEPNDPQGKFLHVIIEEVDRLNRVVSQFLDYSKPQLVEQETVNLQEVALKVTESARTGIPAEIDLSVQSDAANRPIQVSASALQLHQILLNFIQNSVQSCFRKVGAGHVRVRTGERIHGSRREGYISVEDDGEGIRREHMDKIFIPFFTTSPQGTGLGLSICQKIIEAHQGRIEVQSEFGKYARFTVVLPMVNSQGKSH